MESNPENHPKLSEREKGYARMRSIMDIGMGLLWSAMGIFIAFIRYFNTDLARQYDNTPMKVFGWMAVAYGLFRVYRGVKKNYFNER